MIAWPVSAALAANAFSRVIVSTEDEEIARVAVDVGAEVPFMRPKELSGDHVGLMEVIRHAISWLEKNGERPAYMACVYATAAFLRPADLSRAIQCLRNHEDAEFVLSVGHYPATPFQAMTLASGDRLKFIWPKFAEKRTQDLPETFFDTAQFVVGQTRRFMVHSNTLSGQTIPYILPKLCCQDIDSLQDWEYAEKLFEVFKQNHPSNRG